MSQSNSSLRSRSASWSRACAAALAVVAAGCASTDAPKPKKTQPVESLSPEEIGRRVQSHGTPGIAHQALNGRVGTWQCEIKYWMPGMDEPVETSATSEIKWTMDGLFLEDRTRGDFGGQPFKGLGHVGYDNLKQRYVSMWIDNTATSIHTSEGGYDPEARTFRYTGKMPDPVSGRFLDTRSTERMVDENTWLTEAWALQPNGEERKVLEISYKRVR